jgi:phage terminase large subunit
MYAVVEGDRAGFSPRGGALDLWRCRDHEVMLSGPAETGKTYSCLQKLNALAWKYPGSQSVVIRKTLSSLYTSVLKTYKNVLGAGSPVVFYGGEKPEWADYPNGSRVYFAGMDNATKALSSERDFIYVNQSEELTVEDWETLTTRCTGRAANAPYAQIFGDCNPGPPTHWILHRPSLKVFESRHEHNPTLFDEAGNITPRGAKSLAVLDRLTGVRKQRLRYGRWVQAEGAVYEAWDRAVHLIPGGDRRFPRYVASVDWGFTAPGCLQLWGVDGDRRMYLCREYYRTRRLIGWWVERAREIHKAFRPEVFACDPAEPGFIQEFQAAKLPAIGAFNDIELGIQAVMDRLSPAEDGSPRLFVLKDSLVDRDEDLFATKKPTCLADEMELYMWQKSVDGRPVKERPVDDNNHAADCGRYAVSYVDQLGSKHLGGPYIF